jgi:hypothetical protein
MHAFKWAKIALLLAEEDRYAPYYREALDHAGVRHDVIAKQGLADLGRIDILVLAGYGQLTQAQEAAIATWVRGGGQLVCSGGFWSLSSILGVTDPTRHTSNETASPRQEDRLWPAGVEQVRFFGGTVGSIAGCEAIATTSDDKVAVSRRKVGRGTTFYIAPHIGLTMALMQLGRSVETDGVGPADTSARLDDNNLRSEDGSNLDFGLDRRQIGDAAPYFAFPHVDVLREILVRAILNAADNAEVNAIVMWHWPRQSTATAMMSLDCESFDSERVQKMHRLLSMYGCRAAWMVALPGYSLDVYRALRSWEHEVGLIFVTDDAGGWHEEKLKIQHVALSRNAAIHSMIACRPLDGKWRGYTNFYDLAEAAGARLSLSKGGRQPGTTGFLFGTSHPFFPLKKDGNAHLLAEQPYTVYMPGQVTADAVADAILTETISRYGCFHMALRPEALENPECFGTIRRLLSECKQRRIEFLLPEELHRFERGRRAMRMLTRVIGDEGHIQLAADTKLEGLTVMITGGKCEVQVRGKAARSEQIERYGTVFQAVQIDLEPKQQSEIHFSSARLVNQAA